MLDFGVLPPEITSTQMYTGPGSGPMMVAASAWDTLAAQGALFAQGCTSAISALAGQHWAGSAAAAMAAAAAPYLEWAAATGAQAEQAAVQLRAAAAAFEIAHAATVPPAVVAANRAQLAQLIATNVLGQNTVRIAATEAAYQAMWAQNTHALYGYAASASSATKLSPFQQAPQTTNPAGQSAQAAATTSATAVSGASNTQGLSQLLAAVPQQLATASTSQGIPVPQAWVNDLEYASKLYDYIDSAFLVQLRDLGSGSHAAIAWARIATDGALYAPLSAGLTSPGSGALMSTGLTGSTSPAVLSAETAAAPAGTTTGRTVLAGVGEATSVGRLSVPQVWADVTPVAAVNDQLSPLAKGGWETAPPVHVAGTGRAAAMAPMAQAAGAVAARKIKRPSVSTILQVTPPRYTMPRHSSGG